MVFEYIKVIVRIIGILCICIICVFVTFTNIITLFTFYEACSNWIGRVLKISVVGGLKYYFGR
jgi:hypothetical protein